LIGTGASIFILVYWGSNFYSGVSAAAIALTYVFSPAIAGRISDRIGRRNTLLIATTSNFAIACFFLIVVITVQSTRDLWLIAFIIILRLMEGVANGFFWPILQASLSDVSLNCCNGEKADFEAISRRGMSTYNLGWNLGVLFGQVLLSFITFWNIDMALVVPVVSQGLNLIIVIKWFHVPKNIAGRAPVMETPEEIKSGNKHGHVNMHVLTLLLGLIFIFMYGFGLGDLSTSTTNLYEAQGFGALVGFTEAARLACQGFTSSKVRLHKHLVQFKLVLVSGLLVVIFVIMAFLSDIFIISVFIALFACSGLLFGILYAESMNLVVMSGSTAKRGLLMGMFESFIGLGFFIGPLLAGYITQFIAYSTSYFMNVLVMVVMMAICIIMALILAKNGQNQVIRKV